MGLKTQVVNWTLVVNRIQGDKTHTLLLNWFRGELKVYVACA